MICEYETAINKILELSDILKNRDYKKPIWNNGKLDKKIKDRLMTISKILNK